MGKKAKSGKGFGGFTLIELMIVIAIIAILAAVAIPNFMNARDRARLSGGQQAASNLAKALEMFYNDYNAYPGANGAAASIAACNLDTKLTAAEWEACLGSTGLKISNVKQQMGVFAGDTLTISDFNPDTTYAIEGKLRDRGGSYICVSPNGIITMINKSDGTFDRCDPAGVAPPTECTTVDTKC